MYYRAVEIAEIAHQRLAFVAFCDAARLQFVGALAAGTLHLLTIAGEVHRSEIRTVGATAVVGPQAVEVCAADEETDIVAGTQSEEQIVLLVGADDVVLTRGLAVVAGHVDVAICGLGIAAGGHIDVGARTLDGSEQQTRRVLVVTEREVAGIAAADEVFC